MGGEAPPANAIRWGGSTSPNMAADVHGLPDDPGAVEPLWELKLGSHQYSIPTLDRGRIYLGINDAGIVRPGFEATAGGAVLCVEQATGKLLWQLPIPRNFDGVKAPYHFDQWSCGICSGPLVEGKRVYVVGSRGDLLCLDREGQADGNDGPFLDELGYMGLDPAGAPRLGPQDGDIVWRYNLLSELGINGHDVCGSTLLLVGDLLFASTANGIDDRHYKIPKPLAPTLIALDKRTGKLVARDDEKIGTRLLHCNWSSPLAAEVAGRILVFFGGGDGILYAFELPSANDGKEVQILQKAWSCDCNPPEYRVRDGQPVPYSSASRNTPLGPSEIIGTPVFHQGRIYAAIGQSPVHGTGQGQLACVDAATGKIMWASKLVDRTLATAALADGLLYLPDNTGNLHCFDALTGERFWVHPLGAKTWCASAFVADGKVYAGDEASVLWVLKAGKEKQVLSRTRLKSPPITPTAAEGVLYLPTQKSLAALPGKTPPRKVLPGIP